MRKREEREREREREATNVEYRPKEMIKYVEKDQEGIENLHTKGFAMIGKF